MFEFNEDKFTLLMLLMKSKGLLNANEMDWIKNINNFNKKVIFPKFDTDPDFPKIMAKITYKQFEDHCRQIALQEESAQRQRETEEGL